MQGLSLITNFITQEEHDALLKFIYEQKEWASAPGQRRVLQYGYKYNYTERDAKPEKTTPIPDLFVKVLLRKLEESKEIKLKVDQVIVNEYEPGQGIAPHIDHTKHFGPVVASLSLGWAYNMNFAKQGGEEKKQLLLPVCSLLVLQDEARYKWTHSIERRLDDTLPTGETAERGTRVSITFRSMKE